MWRLITIVLLLSSGCGKQPGQGASDNKLHPDAQRTWATLCVTCHHTDGSGKGLASKTLDPKPRDFRSARWQKSVTDAHLETVIVQGGAKAGLSPQMPGSPEMAAKPHVVRDLIKKIRGFRSAQP